MKAYSKIRNFGTDEGGAITALMVFMTLIFFTVAGIAIDLAFAYKSRTELQMAADSAAHAALYTRQDNKREDAQALAVEVAEATLHPAAFGDVLRAEDILFGYWDEELQTFVIDPTSKDGVMVSTARFASTGNAVPTFFLGMVGMSTWDVRTGSVFRTYMPTCLREGFAADDVVDVQSNNSFYNGFCIHSNTHVKLSSDNFFADGTVVSMPDKTNIDLPNSGFESNQGLEAALRDGKYDIRILNRLTEIEDSLRAGDEPWTPDYITSSTAVSFSQKKIGGMVPPSGVDTSDANTKMLQKGRIYTKSCTGGSALSVEAGVKLEEVVILTNCKINFGQGVELNDVVVLTTNTSSKSISSASSLQVGKDDGCATGGGAQILTWGSVDVPADMRLYGGQIIARHDINFSANANGIEGASLIAGGNISGTSNMTMGFCGSGMEDNFEIPYFQLAT